jgi:hypothetical protein
MQAIGDSSQKTALASQAQANQTPQASLSPQNGAQNGPQNYQNKEAIHAMIQNEMQKFKMLQEKKASLQHELTMIEQNLLKIQGSLEVFQVMGFIKMN